MPPSPTPQGPPSSTNEGRLVLLGRSFAICCFLTAIILVYTQQYAYDESHRSSIHGENAMSSWSVTESTNIDSQQPQPEERFLCSIDQLQLSLPRAPDLIIAGASKCGTTTLAHWLLDHPNVLPTKKWECHFFTTGIHPREFEPLLNQNDNISSEEEREDLICQLRKRYLHQWPDLTTTLAATEKDVPKQPQQHLKEQRMFTFDKTPDYLYPSRVPALIRAMFEKEEQRPKIVIMLRHPIDRAYSHYRMGQRLVREEHVLFEEFIAREIDVLQELKLTNFVWRSGRSQQDNLEETMQQNNLTLQEQDELYDQVSDRLKGHNYLSRGLYAMQLERWFRHGLGDDLLILPHSQLSENPANVYAQLLDFVGMPPHNLSVEMLRQKFNFNDAVTEPLSNVTRHKLKHFYQQANQDLADLLERHNQSLGYDWRTLWD